MSSKPLKWTRQEDERLIKGVQKYGNSWAQVQSEYCQGRTRNAIVKRWHGKLKELNGDLSKMHYSEDDEQSNNSTFYIIYQKINRKSNYPLKTQIVLKSKSKNQR